MISPSGADRLVCRLAIGAIADQAAPALRGQRGDVVRIELPGHAEHGREAMHGRTHFAAPLPSRWPFTVVPYSDIGVSWYFARVAATSPA